MTIFYLPLSFVAVCIPFSILIPSSPRHDSADIRRNQALFGMHLFDEADLKETRTSFYISAMLIAIVTYGLSALAVWWVGDLEREQELKERWQAWKSKRSSKKAKFKDSADTEELEHIWLWKLLRRRKKNRVEPGA
jgi:hypothetical protein